MLNEILRVELPPKVDWREKEHYAGDWLAAIFAGEKKATLSFETTPSLYAFFASEFKKHKIDSAKDFLPGSAPSLTDWMKDLNDSSQKLVDDLNQKYGGQNSFEGGWKEFEWLLPIKEGVTLEMVASSWRKRMQERMIDWRDDRLFEKSVISDCGKTSGNVPLVVQERVFPAMASLKILEEKGFVKDIEDVLEAGVKLLDYHFKFLQAYLHLTPDQYNQIPGFDEQHFQPLVVNDNEKSIGQIGRSNIYEVFDKEAKFTPLMHKFYLGFYGKIKEMVE